MIATAAGAPSARPPPGASFGEARLPARPLDQGMGLAVGRRTVFRPEDAEDFGRVADRVAAGNLSLLDHPAGAEDLAEGARLRNAIATGALLTSGRHLQHGDATQPGRAMELFVNCATAIASFAGFYLLLNGAGVGRAYDDELMAVDWADAPRLLFHLSPEHPDFPRDRAALHRFGMEIGVLAPDSTEVGFSAAQEEKIRSFLADAVAPADTNPDAIRHQVEDSREGWAKAVEILEAMTFRRERDRVLLIDLSAIRPRGAPIRGLQGRPAPGPLSLLRGLLNVRRHVIEPARARDATDAALQPWEQALLADHFLSVEVQSGGARRAARMATKNWRDAGALRFVGLKLAGGLWTANHSLMVDHEFWDRVARAQEGRDLDDPLTRHAEALFAAATRGAWINGEPGFLNGDLLEDHRTGFARRRPVCEDGSDVRSTRYRADAATALLAELSRRASRARFPATTNPCGEVVLHVAGGYCVVGDFAPLLACPVPLEQIAPGAVPVEIAALWDERVADSVRLGVRFLIRVNRMDALYAREVARTNRIGIGPTGLHEWAWLRFGLGFRDLLDEAHGAPFWAALARLSATAKQEALEYAATLGLAPPATVTTIKPAGTTAKLFGLTEGAHLPARREYVRWVQFRGTKETATAAWSPGSDPLLAEYERRGYPVRALHGVPGMSIVGFPTRPLASRLGMGARLVTALEAAPEEQYRWLRLLERHWIGAERGNQVSYTLKLPADMLSLSEFRHLVLENQSGVRGCTLLPVRPDHALGYEYLPEESVDEARFAAILAGIHDPGLHEAVDMARLRCAACPCPS